MDWCYIILIKGVSEELFNDFFTLEFVTEEEICEEDKKQTSIQKLKAIWKQLKSNGPTPPARNSHSSCVYKNEYIIIIGGEGSINKGNYKIITIQKYIENTWL